jgi:hypothetical protein
MTDRCLLHEQRESSIVVAITAKGTESQVIVEKFVASNKLNCDKKEPNSITC